MKKKFEDFIFKQGKYAYIDGDSFIKKLIRYSYRFKIRKRKLSTKNLERLCRKYATNQRTLVVHSEDVNYQPYFPNAYAVTKRTYVECDMYMDLYYKDLSKIPDNSYELVFCTGLLEHIPDPQRIVDDLRRICKVGGKVVVSASSVFSYHEGPDDFFHFTPYSMELLFSEFSSIDMNKGSSQPFETIGILLERILLQCDMPPFVRPIIEILSNLIPLFDIFVIAQFDTNQKKYKSRMIHSMMPSNIQVAATK